MGRAKSIFERMGFTQEKRDITPKQFDYIYRNKVKDKLEKKGEMQFHEVNLLLGAYEYYRYEKKSKKTLQSLEQAEQLKSDQQAETEDATEGSKKSTEAEEKMGFFKRYFDYLAGLMTSPHYELAQNITSLLNVVLILINDFIENKTARYIKIWMIVMMIINIFFLLETVLDIIVFGIVKAYKQHLRIWFETVCQIMNTYLFFTFLQDVDDLSRYNSFEKVFTAIIFIRALKMLTLMYEVKSLRIIIETMKNLIEPISNMMAVLLIVYYIFALIGMFFFGGKIKKNLPYPLVQGTNTVPATYHLDNFNDFISSMVTLFTLMVVNNWMVQVSQYIVVMSYDGVNENLVRLYFILFFQFSVVIGINLVVAYVLDMYGSTERLDEERHNTLEILEKEMTGNREQKEKDQFDQLTMMKNQMMEMS